MHYERRGPDTWLLTWELGRDPATGQRLRKRQTIHGDEAAAAIAWAEEAKKQRNGTALEPSTLTVGAWLTEWLTTIKGPDIRPRTRETYGRVIDHFLIPALGGVRLRDLRPAHLQPAIREWQTRPRANHQGGTLGRTIEMCGRVLKSALATAVRWQLVERNVAELVDWPTAPRAEAAWWTAAEAQKFLAAPTTSRYAIAWQLALLVGLRKGEVLGLRWTDIDEKAGTLSVVQIRQRSNVEPFGPPKTARARRTVALDPSILALLKAHRKRIAAERLKAGPAYPKWDLVVATAQGHPATDRNLTRALHDAQDRAGVRRIPFHGLRHTHASLLLEATKNIRVIADRLGHTRASFTADLYVHAALDSQRAGAEQVAAQLLGPQNGHILREISTERDSRDG